MSRTERISASPSAAAPGPFTRRAVLQGGTLGALGLSWDRGRERSSVADLGAVILLAMVGGASPWETLDPQLDAPAHRRGPFGSIATVLPGVRVGEHLPEVARRLGRLSLIRSIYHDADPTHNAGLDLLATGRSDRGQPALGARVARRLGSRGGMPPFVVLPGLVESVADRSDRVDRAGAYGPAFEPFVVDPGSPDPRAIPDSARRWVDRAVARGLATAGADRSDRLHWNWVAERGATAAAYGTSEFGRNCWLARRLVEAGSRFVVVNMATTVFGQPSWDAHGRPPFGNFDDYARTLLPAFDRGFTGLVDDLQARGLLDSTLVVATGEMGRTPWINESGGRDHWPGVWSALVAGGGTLGGQVIGSSTPDGRPGEWPVPLADLVATMGHVLGETRDPGTNSEEATPRPVLELFG